MKDRRSVSASGGSGLVLYTGAAEWQQHAAQVEAVRPNFDGIKVQLLTDGPLAPSSKPMEVASGWPPVLLAATCVSRFLERSCNDRVIKSHRNATDRATLQMGSERPTFFIGKCVIEEVR
jgi:hypothetical protein